LFRLRKENKLFIAIKTETDMLKNIIESADYFDIRKRRHDLRRSYREKSYQCKPAAESRL